MTSLIKILLLISFSVHLSTSIEANSSHCIISNCAVRFYCYDCLGNNVCKPQSLVKDFVSRPSSCEVYSSNDHDTQIKCPIGCQYCFNTIGDNGTFQQCTICRKGYQLLYSKCYVVSEDNFTVDMIYESINQQILTINYLNDLTFETIRIQDKIAPNFSFSTSTIVLTSLFVVFVYGMVINFQYSQFVRVILFLQHLYHFSYIRGEIVKSQYVLSFLNMFNMSFLNELVNILPSNYVEAVQNQIYFILNLDQNIIRNAGGSILSCFIVLLLFFILIICELITKNKLVRKYSNYLILAWCLTQNNIIYFSLNNLLKVGSSEKYPSLSIIVKILCGVFILLFFAGILIIYKLFNNHLSDRIQKYELIALMFSHFLINILLSLAFKSISQHFVVLIHLLFISVCCYIRYKQKNNQILGSNSNNPMKVFLVSECFSLSVYIYLLVDLESVILIIGIVSYIITTIWDLIIIKKEIKSNEELRSFRDGSDSMNAKPQLILMTEADMISYPTMKKLHSAASTDV